MVRPEVAGVYRTSLVTGLAVAFAIMGAVLATVGAATGNWFALVPAALFGATAYFMWYHASGRLADRVYRSFERAATRQGATRHGATREGAARRGATRQRAPGQGATRNRHAAPGEEDPWRSRRTATDGRGGFGAGPRGDWERPGGQSRERVRQERARYERARRQRAREHAQRIGGRGRRRRGQQATGMTVGKAAKILGVPADADEDAVRTAYRERIKEVHPDTDGGDEERFKRVRDAYEVLSES